MAAEGRFAFGPFRFDARSGQLSRDGAEVALTPRAAAVLCMLAERAPELVTKRELFERIWGGLAVGDDALTSCIQELRGALGDDARRPHTIETRHRRGYRLMVAATPVAHLGGTVAPMRADAPDARRLVGRTTELAELARSFDQACAGRRQIVLVTGEAGIGKSALADAFIDQLRGAPAARIARGQCVDHHGLGEPYLPLIDALTRLARAPDGTAIKEILAAHAPSWRAAMPSLWPRSETGAAERRGRATRERLLRELTDTMEVIAAEAPLVLALEDLHWSDASTLDWLAHVARRPEPARLMVLATLRPADRAAGKSGLDRLLTELALHGWCREIALDPLGLEAIEAYLRVRLADDGAAASAHEMAPLLLERTGGNPLFMTSIVRELAKSGADGHGLGDGLGAVRSIPHDVRRFIDLQIDALDQGDRDLMMAASVIGREFATAAVTAALPSDADAVETGCARLSRQGMFIVAAGSTAWPDGTRAELYSFRHDLYRELLYDRLAATRRAAAHARVGGRFEAAWAGALDTVAVELAEHFERGNEAVRATPHHRRAAATALRRSANGEAIRHLRRALDAIGTIADTDERAKVEIELRVGIGAAHMAMDGFGAPEVLEAYTRAQSLCDRLGERVDLFPALWGQWMFRTGRGETVVARRLGARLLALAAQFGDAGLKIQAHHAMWSTSFVCGEHVASRAHAQSALALFDDALHHPMASSYGNHDAACCGRNFSAISLALTGDEPGARAMIGESIATARALDDPFTLALTLYFTSAAAQMLGDVALATENATVSLGMATEHDLAQPRAWSAGVAGWCAAENGDLERGLALTAQAIDTMRAIQSRHFLVYLLGLFADVRLVAGHHAEAMQAVQEALVLADETGERFYSAELERLRGELLARAPDGRKREAQSAFRAAVKIARQQGAATLERRATASLQRWSNANT